MRSNITFGMMPQYTAVRPLYKLMTPSRSMMRRAVPTGPREAVTVLLCLETELLEFPMPKLTSPIFGFWCPSIFGSARLLIDLIAFGSCNEDLARMAFMVDC